MIIFLDPNLISDILDIRLKIEFLFIDWLPLFAYTATVINKAWKSEGIIKK